MGLMDFNDFGSLSDLRDDRRFFVPEVVQTSAMDCGPATLKCLLEGFDISVSYGRLREACQTDVDGTSIDTMEEVAIQLGLEAEQIMVPADYLLLEESQYLPAIVVTRLPNGLTHFVVAWRRHGKFIQVMDPATGRRWMTRRRFLGELFQHTHPVPAMAWREWAGSDELCHALPIHAASLGVEDERMAQLMEQATQDPSWYSLAALDAGTRLLDTIVRANGLDRGPETGKVLESFFHKTLEETPGQCRTIPQPFWSVLPSRPDILDVHPEEQELFLKGAVLVRVRGKRESLSSEQPKQSEQAEQPERAEMGEASQEHAPSQEESSHQAPKDEAPPLSPELAAALEEEQQRPEREIFKLLRKDGLLTPSTMLLGICMAATGVTIEAMLFRGLLDIGSSLHLMGERGGAMVALFVFLIGLFLLEIALSISTKRIGRRLEIRLRAAFLEKIPKLGDRYLHSRLISDMTQRIYDLRDIRALPQLVTKLLHVFFYILLTAGGIIMLVPDSAFLAILATIVSIGTSFATQPFLYEKDLRVRTHIGALSRYYLDALLGLVPLRTHRAERAYRRGHEALLVEWTRSSREYYRSFTVLQGLNALVWTGFAVWLMRTYIYSGGEASGVLLLFYWTLNLPALGKSLAELTQQYPLLRNRFLRLLEPLGAPEEDDLMDEDSEEDVFRADTAPTATQTAVEIDMKNLGVQAGGQTILQDITLNIKPGEHVGIVGPSGAGKSSLVGLLLGWHRPAWGTLLVDNQPLIGKKLARMRRNTAWVDPGVQLWNKPLYENLQYGNDEASSDVMSSAIELADLYSILERLPQGLKTPLGESGGLVSGGEGQRVRYGRSLLRTDIKLVILDEPFRGLDRDKRRTLLTRAREHWKDATLLFISHDVGETRCMDRVLVVEEGRIVEDNTPDVLEQPGSRYKALIDAEDTVRKGLWGSTTWRRIWMDKGNLSEIEE